MLTSCVYLGEACLDETSSGFEDLVLFTPRFEGAEVETRLPLAPTSALIAFVGSISRTIFTTGRGTDVEQEVLSDEKD